MRKPKFLEKGDKVALVSLSSGVLGDEKNRARLERAVNNLRDIFGLEVVFMPNALLGTEAVYEHPGLRAKDWMDAFLDESIKAIFTLTGGDDTIRLLPYVDFEVMRNNPKIFLGFSDTTINHFMMYKAGVVSYYGPAAGVELSLKDVPEQDIKTINEMLFGCEDDLELRHAEILANDPIDWEIGELRIAQDAKGYEVVQGEGNIEGVLLGGCLDVFLIMNGTEIWPSPEEWKGKILFAETSEVQPSPDFVKHIFYNLGAQGVLGNLNGLLLGRPKDGKYYEEYKEVITEVLRVYGRSDLPVIANCHFGHAWLWNIMPIGVRARMDCDKREIRLLETPTAGI